MKIVVRRTLILICSAGAVGMVAASLLASSASAAVKNTQEAVSENWSGYVAAQNNFSSVSGSWVQPSAKCTSGQSYSAFWVGLGGASGNNALEQTGTQADCSGDGQTDYYAWYELVPSGPVRLNLAVSPGDHISARVSVSGSNVTVALSDQTTGASVTKTLQMSSPDTSSAEWIAEAPSSCTQDGDCQPLPLTDFGTVTFTNASATANGHTGPISDSEWQAQAVQLSGDGGADGYVPTAVDYQSSSSGSAQPSSLTSNGSSFAVSWQSSSSQSSSSGGDGYPGGGGYGDGGGGYPGSGGGGGYGYPGVGGGYGYPGGGGYGYGSGGYGGGYGYGAGGGYGSDGSGWGY